MNKTKRVKEYIENGRLSMIYRVLLLIWDAICINACSYLALFMRYDLNVDRFLRSGISEEYPLGYVATLQEMMLFNTLITLIIFFVFRLYNSLWRYAGINEVINIAFACGLSGVIHFFSIFGTYRRMPRSYFIIYMLLLFIMTLLVLPDRAFDLQIQCAWTGHENHVDHWSRRSVQYCLK